ncbi:MAG: hypothetical protein M1820_005882 [Bogoriella megaspora]|nr:MAG: hypothetical protein M1820_005882 [Bogoriella megaspora]
MAKLILTALTLLLSATTTLAQNSFREYHGHATYYDPSVGKGSCGALHNNTEFIVAVNADQMTPNKCNRQVWITNVGGGDAGKNHGVGNSVVATVTDTCLKCGKGSLDLSQSLAEVLHGPELEMDGGFEIAW